MSLLSMFAHHKSETEQRLNDLTSKAEHLAYMSGRTPLNWHEFRNAPNEIKRFDHHNSLSYDGSTLGMIFGVIGGVGVGAAAINLFGLDAASSNVYPFGAIGGGIVGAGIGGTHYVSPTDRRDELVTAYAHYLSDFEQHLSDIPQLSSQPTITAPCTPSGRRLQLATKSI